MDRPYIPDRNVLLFFAALAGIVHVGLGSKTSRNCVTLCKSLHVFAGPGVVWRTNRGMLTSTCQGGWLSRTAAGTLVLSPQVRTAIEFDAGPGIRSRHLREECRCLPHSPSKVPVRYEVASGAAMARPCAILGEPLPYRGLARRSSDAESCPSNGLLISTARKHVFPRDRVHPRGPVGRCCNASSSVYSRTSGLRTGFM